MSLSHPPQAYPTSQRGVALLAAMCFSLVLVIALGSYITVCYRSLQMSTRNMNSSHSVELAETGMEEALWALNKATWTGWAIDSTTATKTLTGFDYDNGATGSASLTVTNYDGSLAGVSRTVTVTGTTTLGDGTTNSRTLSSTSAQAPLFVNAVAGASSSSGRVRFRSGGTVDSYDSSTDPNATTLGYSAIVASNYVTTSTAPVQMLNIQIRGYVATPSTSIAPSFSTSAKLIGSAAAVSAAYQAPTNASVDIRRFSTSPYQPLFDQVTPTGTATVLPSGTSTIGTAGAASPTLYSSTGVALSGSQTLTIDGPVVLNITGDLSISSSAKIVITTNGSLEIHLSGDLALGGSGIQNLTKLPKNLLIAAKADNYYDALAFSTTTAFHGVIYTPNNSITFSGNSLIYGAIVSKSVTFNNSPTIHYDMDLRNVVFRGIDTPYAVSDWHEVSN